MTQQDEASTAASSTEEIEAIVHSWLCEFELLAQTGA